MLNRDKAAGYLKTAADLISGPRAQTHDPDGRQGEVCAALWSAYLGVKVSEADVWQMMALVKMSRAKCGDGSHDDHYVDAAAYSAMAGAIEADKPKAEIKNCTVVSTGEGILVTGPAPGLDLRSGTEEQLANSFGWKKPKVGDKIKVWVRYEGLAGGYWVSGSVCETNGIHPLCLMTETGRHYPVKDEWQLVEE